jgi:TonB-linked SusC/RagA family outer membrane protein
MYKFYTRLAGPCPRCVHKFLMIMRITTFLLITTFIQVSAASYAQRITLKQTHAPLEKVFVEIRKQTGFDFVFDVKLMQKATPVSIHVNNASVDQTLKLCFENQPFEYTVNEKTIVVKEKEKSAFNKVSDFFTNITVTGKVTDVSGNVLSGITVTVKGTGKSTLTNQTGTFILPDLDENAILVFSSLTKETIEIKLNGRRSIEVVMKEKTLILDEITVNTGYQILKKSDVVGSTASVKAKDLYLNGLNTLEQALQGKLAGVVVSNTSGLVGTKQTVRVRGTSTLSGSQEPIWVVDGVIQEDPLPFKAQTLNSNGDITPDNFDYIRNFVGNSIRWLNPMDIEDITVLKDASATAIYGVRAANGVIVITTKKGQVGPPVINYSTSFSITEKVNYDKLNLMNSKERVAVSREIFERGLTSSFVNSNIGYAGALNEYLYKKTISAEEFKARVDAMETVNTDWFDLLFRAPISNNHNLGISGGNANTRYYSSFGYGINKGTAIGNDASSFTGNLSVSSQLSKKFNISIRLSASQNKTNGFYIVDSYSYASNTNRAIAAYTPDGQLNFYTNKSGYLYNAINERDNTGNTNKVLSANGVLNATYEIIPGLRVQSLFSYNTASTNGESYATDRTEYIATTYRANEYNSLKSTDAAYINSKLPVGGILNETTNTSNAWNWRNSLSYNKVFGKKHTFSAMFGQEINSTRYNGYANTTLGYLRDRGRTFATLPQTITSAKTVNSLLTLFTPSITDKLTNTMGLYLTSSYSYDNRYVVNMSVRNDRSNRFGQFTNEKFNPVWAGGVRWNVANEKWFAKSYWLSNLSVSGTFGFQRNIASNVSPDLIIKYPTGAAVNSTDVFTGDYLLTISSLPYGDLRWEENSSMNLGLNFGLFNNKIQGSFEYYNKNGKKLITTLSVPQEYGVTNMLVNGGSMTNKGYEVSANFVPVRTKNFTWSVSLNTSKNINTVTEIGSQVVSWSTAASGTLNKIGKPVSGFYAFKYVGIDQTNGYPKIDLSVAEGADPKDPTSFMTYVGKLDPDFTSGLNMNFRYKMLTLNSGFYLQIGGKKFLAPLYKLTNNLPTEYQNLSRQILDRWTPSNTSSTIPGLPDSSVPTITLPNGSGIGTNVYEMYNYSTDRVVSASTLRCNNINLSYSLPESVVKYIKCKNINVGAGVSNPFAINSKDFKGLDAEVASGSQPRTRAYTINLNLSL